MTSYYLDFSTSPATLYGPGLPVIRPCKVVDLGLQRLVKQLKEEMDILDEAWEEWWKGRYE